MLKIVFSNEDLVIVDKPAGIPCHPLKQGGLPDSALEAITEIYPDIKSASTNLLEGGLVYRLDNNTSGLLLFARNIQTHNRLTNLLKMDKLVKVYTTILCGSLKTSITLNDPIAHHAKNKRKMVVVKDNMIFFRGKPKPAQTSIKPVAWGKEATLAEITITGGRRHQIRVHLANLGFPLLGDALYNGKPAIYLPGHALHVHSLSFDNKSWTAPLPDNFSKEAKKYGIGF